MVTKRKDQSWKHVEKKSGFHYHKTGHLTTMCLIGNRHEKPKVLAVAIIMVRRCRQ